MRYPLDMIAIEWREIRPGIFVSNEGEVARKPGGKGIGTGTKIGYRHVSIKGKTVGVHRLVAEAFLGPAPSEGHHVNHKNGAKWDNRVENLEWATPSENQRHRFDVLRIGNLRGEKVPGVRLNETKVREVRVRLKAGESRVSIAHRYGVNSSTIRAIELGISWKWLS